MPVTETITPMRQLTRLRNEMGLACVQMTNAMFPDRPELAIEFGIIARVCLPDWVAGDTLMRARGTRCAISMRQIASSLQLPAETIRRRVHELVEIGAVVGSPRGVSLAATADNEARVLHYLTGVHDLWIRMTEDLARTSDIAFPVRDTPGFAMIDVIERAIDTMLLPLDAHRPPMNSVAFAIWAALTAVAVRPVTYDPVLARRFAATIPDDALRLGVSLRALTEPFGIPYASAWRHMQMLERRGLATRRDDGLWTVLTANLLAEPMRDIAAVPSAIMLRRLRELALLGLDPGHAADLYRAGRPPLADLGLSRSG